MELAEKINNLWEREKKQVYPTLLDTRSYAFFENKCESDLLVLGLNPIYSATHKPHRSVQYNIKHLMEDASVTEHYYNKYISRIKQFLTDSSAKVDLTTAMAYTDLFYYRTTLQESWQYYDLLKKNSRGILFLKKQLFITQDLIENIIRPKVIVVTDWEVLPFFGIGEENFLTSYRSKLIDKTSSGLMIYEIEGSKLRETRVIFSPGFLNGKEDELIEEINESVLFSEDYYKLDKRPIVLKNKDEFMSDESSGNSGAIEILNSIYSVAKIMHVEPRQKYLEADGRIFIAHPTVYEQYLSPQLRAKNEKVVLNLKSFKSMEINDIFKNVLTHLYEENLLSKKDVLLLCSSFYCKEQFAIEGAILRDFSKELGGTFFLNNTFGFNHYSKIYILNSDIKPMMLPETKKQLENWYWDKIQAILPQKENKMDH